MTSPWTHPATLTVRRWGLSRGLLPILFLAFLSLACPTHAESLAADFDAANKLYDAGRFSEAAAAYQKLTQSSLVSAPLYFNLGNAFFKAGEIGHAIVAYRQAERLAPRDPDIRANLQFARNQVQGPTLSLTRWQRWLTRLTLNEWTLLSAAALWCLFLLLAFSQLRPALKPNLRNYLIAVAVFTISSCACLAAAFPQNESASFAIVISRDTAVHSGPLDEAPAVFTTHDGAELRVLDRKDDWLQVSLDPRRIGWVHRNQVQGL